MHFQFTVNVEVERQEGKFASREEISELLEEAIAGADPGNVEPENGSTYEVISWEIEEVQLRKRSSS